MPAEAAEQYPRPSEKEIYVKLLLHKEMGYPLWTPEPYGNQSMAGVDIGDVGIITSDGEFDFLFNICRARDDPVNSLGVPDGFEPLILKPNDVTRIQKWCDVGTHISSPQVRLQEEDSGNVP
jgi:hypothetical protein